MAPVTACGVIALVCALISPAASFAAAPGVALTVSGYAPTPGVPTGMHLGVTVADEPDTTSPPQLRGMALALPAGFALQGGIAGRTGGVAACASSDFRPLGGDAATCAESSLVGTAAVDVDGVGPMAGNVYLGSPAGPDGLPAVLLEASVGGSSSSSADRIKLVGTMTADGAGTLTVDFDQLSRRISSLDLSLGGGAHALLVSPPSCSAPAAVATATGVDGSTSAAAASANVNSGCAAAAFAPTVALSTAPRTAGVDTSLAVAVTRPDRAPALTRMALRLPAGLLAHIGDAVECPLGTVAAGGCPAGARLGSARLVSGAGADPVTLSGDVYVVPRDPGDVAEFAIAVNARIGGLDLGRVVVPLHVALRPTDAGLDVTGALPATWHGLGVLVRELSLDLDRPGFWVNPAACGPVPWSGTLTGTSGASQGVDGGLPTERCSTLAFVPTLSARFGGETGPLGHPNVTVGLDARPGDSTLRAATVTLPRGVLADTANLRNTCKRADFDAGACSAAARIGTTTAWVALTPEPIPGDVYLLDIPGAALPGLGLSFTGRYTQRVVSTVRTDVDSRIVVRFPEIPDLPLRHLDLTIIGGSGGPLQMAAARCTDGAVWDAAFQGQGGQASSHTIAAPCALREARRAAITLSSRLGLTVRLTDLGGRKLSSLKVSMPKGFVVDRARAASTRLRTLALDGGSGRLTTTKSAVQVIAVTRNTTTLSLQLRGGTIRRAGTVTAARSVIVPVRIAFTDGTVQRQKIRVRAS